ncbi:MAG: LptF/LptG family permease [Acidobacteriota bacterium]|nr:MAG: LptF/LptG family permease [Acidobacteriota bacterium]
MKLWGRLDRYIQRQLLTSVLLGLSAFTLVFVINKLFLLARQTIEKRVPVSLVLGFLFAFLPFVFVVVIPMATLLGILVAVGRMASQHEMVAFGSVGVRPTRSFRPVLVLALVLTAASLGLAHYLVPLGVIHERSLYQEVIRARDLSREIDPGVFYNRLPGTVLYARAAAESPEQGRILEGVVLYQEAADASLASLIVARRARGVFHPNDGRISLLLDEGERHIWQPDKTGTYHVIRFPKFTLTFPPDVGFRALVGQGRRNDHKDAVGPALPALLGQLERERDETRSQGRRIALGYRIRRAQLEWHRRWSFPLAVLVLAFAGFPLAARTRRGGRFAGLSQALAIIFLFWLLLYFGLGLSEQGTWPVWLGPWLPHALMLVWGLVLWRTLIRGRSRRVGGGRGLGSLLARVFGIRPERSALGRLLTERWIGLTRLDTYLSSGHLKMLLVVLAVLLVLAAALELKEGIEDIAADTAGFPWNDLVTYVGLSLPGHLRFMLPIAALFGAMISLAALAHAGEIVALKANGVGPLRMAAPLLLVTLVLAGLYGVIQETIVPSAARESQRALDRLRGRPSTDDVQTGRRWLLGEDGHLWSSLGWDPRRSALVGPQVITVDLDQGRVLEQLQAREATHSEAGWRFSDGWRRGFAAERPQSFARFATRSTSFREPAALFGETRTRLLPGQQRTDQMTLRELRSHLARVSRSGYNATPLEVGVHEKLAQPLLAPLLVLLGAPLILGSPVRHGSRYGFGVALLISFGFWAVWAVTTSLGREGVLSPMLAVWLPPAILAVCGLALLVRAR